MFLALLSSALASHKQHKLATWLVYVPLYLLYVLSFLLFFIHSKFFLLSKELSFSFSFCSFVLSRFSISLTSYRSQKSSLRIGASTFILMNSYLMQLFTLSRSRVLISLLFLVIWSVSGVKTILLIEQR